jgi:hypothetical protein
VGLFWRGSGRFSGQRHIARAGRVRSKREGESALLNGE